MNQSLSPEYILTEHKFWIQIMGDHARFIFFALPLSNIEYKQRAQDFIMAFDQLWELFQTRSDDRPDLDMSSIHNKILVLTRDLYEFQSALLSLILLSELEMDLPPTFLNKMLNKGESYISVLDTLEKGILSTLHPIDYHLMWLFDFVCYVDIIKNSLDSTETDLINKCNIYADDFRSLYLKSLFFNGYLRSGIDNFSALNRLNERIETSVYSFKDFLEHLRDLRVDGRILGTLSPLLTDHMARECCYYIWKLSTSAGTLIRPDCDPTRLRHENINRII